MMFDNPLLNAAFEENKTFLENRLKMIEETNRDIQQIEKNLLSLHTPANQKEIEGLGTIKWDGKHLKLDKTQLIKCKEDIKIKVAPHLIDILKFILKGEG